MIRTLARALGLWLLLGLASASAQPVAIDSALAFYSKGGTYCFRVAPLGTALSEETEWTVMMLTAASNHRNSFRIRSVDPGETGLSKSGLLAAGRFANDVWKFDGTRADFFERFAEGIRDKRLRARVVKLGPAIVGEASSERERAERYLTFADKGSKVSFDKVPDLTPEQFLEYSEHFPD